MRSAVALWSSKWFAVGMGIAIFAWLLHVAAMAFAPLSLVQAVLSGGLVFLTVLAERVFGFKVGPRQWVGVGLMAVGLALLVVILPGGRRALALLARADDRLRGRPPVRQRDAGPLAQARRPARPPRRAARAGLGPAVRRLRRRDQGDDRPDRHPGAAGLASPWLFTCIAASVIAFFASARGLQTGEAVPVITMTSAGANVSCIAGGIIVFGDPMASDPLGIALQSFAFVLVIVAATLTPAPVRAAGTAPRRRLTVPMDESLADGAVVLVADDDEVVRALAVRALEKAGYRVLKTSDGLENSRP